MLINNSVTISAIAAITSLREARAAAAALDFAVLARANAAARRTAARRGGYWLQLT